MADYQRVNVRIGRTPEGLDFGDRRALPRVDASYPVRVLLTETGLGVSGETVNISGAGSLIKTGGPLRIGARYRVYVAAPDGIWETYARVLREVVGHRYAIIFERPLAQPDETLISA